jgi:hypothetical protein
MSDTRTRKLSFVPRPLEPEADVDAEARWMAVPPLTGEAFRWHSSDGMWVSIRPQNGADQLGNVEVASSTGLLEVVDGFDAALALAKEWRNP